MADKVSLPNNQPRNDDLLAIEIMNLNKQFYDNFDTQYFVQKNFYLSALIQNPHALDSTIKSGVKFKKLAYTFDDKGIKELFDDKFLKNLKLDITLNYYHATETLFRLVFAHGQATLKDSPWMEVSLMNDFALHKRKVKDFIEHKYFPGKHEDGIAYLFYGTKEKPSDTKQEDWDKSIKFITETLDYCGGDLLDSFVYNSYKHGLAVLGTEFGFSFGELIKVDKDDALVFLTHEKDKEKPEYYRLYKNHLFIEWETKFALTYQLGAMLDNLISIGKWRYAGGKYKTLLFNADLMQLLNDDGSPFHATVLKEGSILFKKPKAKSQPRHK